MVSISLVGLIFAALYVALRQMSPSSMVVGAFLAFLGVAVFVSARGAGGEQRRCHHQPHCHRPAVPHHSPPPSKGACFRSCDGMGVGFCSIVGPVALDWSSACPGWGSSRLSRLPRAEHCGIL